MTHEEILKCIHSIADDAVRAGFAHGGSINKVMAIVLTEALVNYHNLVSPKPAASESSLEAPTEALIISTETILVPSNEGPVEVSKPRGRPKAA